MVSHAVDAPGIRAGRPLWVAAYPLLDLASLPLPLPPRLRHLIEITRWLAGGESTILRLNEYPDEQIRQAVMASAALPFIFPSRVVDGCAYLDGGLGGPGDRTPVRAFAEQEHCDVLVVVHLHPDSVVSPPSTSRFVRIDIRPSVAAARCDLDRALPLALSSGIPSHLVIRVHGVRVLAADSVGGQLSAIRAAERWLTEAPHVCDPCSMGFRIAAATACANAGSPSRARPHLAEAERISGLWQGGPWTAALWEVRAEVRRAEGQRTQAAALFLEAAERFAAMRRPLEEARCRAAAASLSGP
jgi:hypothetical protein